MILANLAKPTGTLFRHHIAGIRTNRLIYTRPRIPLVQGLPALSKLSKRNKPPVTWPLSSHRFHIMPALRVCYWVLVLIETAVIIVLCRV